MLVDIIMYIYILKKPHFKEKCDCIYSIYYLRKYRCFIYSLSVVKFEVWLLWAINVLYHPARCILIIYCLRPQAQAVYNQYAPHRVV